MKMKLLSAIAVVALLWSCNTKERNHLRAKVDSLQVELEARREATSKLQEVGVLLDSIDASRQLLRSNMVEGTSYADYNKRMSDLNNYIKETQSKLSELEKSKSIAASYAAAIRRLKNELASSTQQLAVLKEEGDRMRNENQALVRTVSQKDSVLNERGEYIKVKEQDLANMETKVQQINEESKNTQANLYFAQAQALEKAAARTKFAPRKKKETRREALELYKIALSLGKTEAQSRINELQKEV